MSRIERIEELSANSSTGKQPKTAPSDPPQNYNGFFGGSGKSGCARFIYPDLSRFMFFVHSLNSVIIT